MSDVADRPDVDSDSGFTLTELILVITILGLILSVLAAAFSVVVRNDESVSARITESRDLQNLTNFLPLDVASARTITATPSAPEACGSGGVVQLHVAWSEDWDGGYYSNRVTYRLLDAPARLVRFECEMARPIQEFTVARAFDSVTFTIATDPLDATTPNGTVTAALTYPDSVRRLSATSRNFIPSGGP